MSASTDEPLDTLVFRPLAARLVGVLAPTRVTANQVSVAGAAAGFAAAACLVHGGAASSLGTPALLGLSLVLDVTDGQLARARGQRSHAGWVMDILADGSKGLAVFAALAVALGRAHGAVGWCWGLAAAASVLLQVLARDHSLHRFERELGDAPEPDGARVARIDAERQLLRAGPPSLARVAMAAYDLARVARPPSGPSAPPRPRRVDRDERARRAAAQAVWRHLGGTAQLVTVAVGAATGQLAPAAALLVTAGNAVLATAALLEWRATTRQRPSAARARWRV